MAQKTNVRLLGLDAPPYYLIMIVERELQRNAEPDKAKEFAEKASLLPSIDDVIKLAQEYVNVI